MSSVAVGLCAAVLAFACGVVGLFLQRKLPEHYTKDHSRDMISAVVGLVTLLSALVMGLLIWTSYGVYTAQRTAVQTFASQMRGERQSMSLVQPPSDFCGPEQPTTATAIAATSLRLRLREIIRESLRELLEVATSLF